MNENTCENCGAKEDCHLNNEEKYKGCTEWISHENYGNGTNPEQEQKLH